MSNGTNAHAHARARARTISKWHRTWQSYFKRVEVPFPRVEGQIRDRRADVCLQNNCVIEFQHSLIARQEVDNRMLDYSLNKHLVIWVIDGADCTLVRPVSGSAPFLILNSWWKYAAFLSYPSVLIDVYADAGAGASAERTDADRVLCEFNPTAVSGSCTVNCGYILSHAEFIRLCNAGEYEPSYAFCYVRDLPTTRVHAPTVESSHMRPRGLAALSISPPASAPVASAPACAELAPHDRASVVMRSTSSNSTQQCTLWIKQQGAGNGKTYGIVQQLRSREFAHYDFFIMVTKQHSAKDIMHLEFLNQLGADLLPNIAESQHTSANKKYVIQWCDTGYDVHGKDISADSTSICTKTLIFATIDSLAYALGDTRAQGVDKFEALINSILTCASLPNTQFGGVQLQLGRRTCLIVDETQDLHERYGQMILKIQQLKHIDAYVVGDLLQSINAARNAFTHLCEFAAASTTASATELHKVIRAITLDPINICRRFSNPALAEFVNSVIRFGAFALCGRPLPACSVIPAHAKYEYSIDCAPMRADAPNTQQATADDSLEPTSMLLATAGTSAFDPVTVFVAPQDNDRVVKSVEQIMQYYAREVEAGAQPADFLIVTPYTTHNPVIEALTTRINMFWRARLGVADYAAYTEYAIFHKSEEGTAIDLTTSIDKTRLVSIHSAKGDGRAIVFVIGITERDLRRWDNIHDNDSSTDNAPSALMQTGLVYESLLHVAITRMRERIYIQCKNTLDDVYKRLSKYIPVDASTRKPVSTRVPIAQLAPLMYNDISALLDFPAQAALLERATAHDKQIIDMAHHNIRYYTMMVNFWLRMVKENVQYRNQSYAVFRQVAIAQVELCAGDMTAGATAGASASSTAYREYMRVLRNNTEHGAVKRIPVLKVSDRGAVYAYYFRLIYDCIHMVQRKLVLWLNGDTTAQLRLCPYEYIVLAYMLSVHERGHNSDISINDLYAITDVYNSSYRAHAPLDQPCVCSAGKFAGSTARVHANAGLTRYIERFYDEMALFDIAVDKLQTAHPGMRWLMMYPLTVAGPAHADVSLTVQYTAIAYDDTTVLAVQLCPQINALNVNKIITESALGALMLYLVAAPPPACANSAQTSADEPPTAASSELSNRSASGQNASGQNASGQNASGQNASKWFHGKRVVSIALTLDPEYHIVEWPIGAPADTMDKILDALGTALERKYAGEVEFLYYSYCAAVEHGQLANVREDFIDKTTLRYTTAAGKLCVKLPPAFIALAATGLRTLHRKCARASATTPLSAAKFREHMREVISMYIEDFIAHLRSNMRPAAHI